MNHERKARKYVELLMFLNNEEFPSINKYENWDFYLNKNADKVNKTPKKRNELKTTVSTKTDNDFWAV